MKKIWIVGSLGHMGQALIRLLDMMEYELYETDKDELDITDEHAVSLFTHRNRHQLCRISSFRRCSAVGDGYGLQGQCRRCKESGAVCGKHSGKTHPDLYG